MSGSPCDADSTTCINTIGSFECTCLVGYTESGNFSYCQGNKLPFEDQLDLIPLHNAFV